MNGQQHVVYSVFPPQPVPSNFHRRRRRNRKNKKDKKKEKKGLLTRVQWAIILTFCWPLYSNIINAMYGATGVAGFKLGEALATNLRSWVLTTLQ